MFEGVVENGKRFQVCFKSRVPVIDEKDFEIVSEAMAQPVYIEIKH